MAGDIAARALRAAGRDVITQSGLDEHQNYVLTRAEARAEPVADTVAHFAELIQAGFAAARIRYDLMLRPMTDSGYQDAVRRLLTELVETKVVEVAPVVLAECGGCGGCCTTPGSADGARTAAPVRPAAPARAAAASAPL